MTYGLRRRRRSPLPPPVASTQNGGINCRGHGGGSHRHPAAGLSHVHDRRVDARFPPRPRPPEGAPNVVVIVLDDLGFAQLGCFGSDIDTPDDRPPRRRAASATTASTSPRCARRRARACSPAATTTPSAWASSPTSRPASPATTAASRRRRPRCPASCATRATARSRSASGTSRPAGSRRAVGPFDRWPLGLGLRALLRLPRRRHQPVDARARARQRLRRPAAHARGGLPPHRGPRRPGDPDDPGPAAGHAGPAVLPLLRAPAPCTRRTRRRGSGSTATAAGSTTAGRRGASELSPARCELGIVPPGTHAHRAADLGAGLGRRSPTTSAACTPGMMEVFAGFLTHTDHQIGRLVDFLRTTGQLDDTLVLLISDNGTSAEGGPPARSTSTGSPTTCSRRPRRHAGAASTSSAGSAPTTTTPGAGRGRATRRCGCGSATRGSGGVRTPLIAHWPDGHHAPRGEVRGQFCHAIDLMPDGPRRRRHRRRRPWSTASTSSRSTGRSLVPTFDEPGAAGPRTTQYFEMLGSRAIVPRRLEGHDRPRRHSSSPSSAS